ncbi:zinc ribbon domain-containing protein [Ornithinibacillus halotolerans]|uniref:Zinc ribbon domain-containing protein n=1 Tax=Ornithinibacillus halotolerans TaxID=1274357 RepID=A0A916RTB2_9BACI|nr:zinc ribbon domain-containing protein [Ornithinibacillus halotolerans]GGA65332.1 hypothetical protein GCM10008025_06480 [Ornithinibacillus halotolerans]
MANVHMKEKNVQIFFLLLLVISYFLPWTTFTPGDISSSILETNTSNLFESTFSFLDNVLAGYLSPLSIGDFFIIILITSQILPPILGSITLYRMIKNKTFKGIKNITIIFSVLIVIIFFISNLNANNVGVDVGELSIKQGFFTAIISTIGLAFAASIAKKFNEIISNVKSKTNNVNLTLSSNNEKTSMNFCSSCGNEIVGNPQYCKNCGNKLNDSFVKGSGNSKQIDKVKELSKRIGIKNGLILFVSITIIIVIINSVSSVGSNTPTGVVKKFINYSEDTKWEKGEELYATRVKNFLQSENATQNIRNIMGLLVYDESGSGKLDGYVVEEEELDDDIWTNYGLEPMEKYGETEVAIVNADLTFDKGRVTDSWQFELVKEDGEWKILSSRPR